MPKKKGLGWGKRTKEKKMNKNPGRTTRRTTEGVSLKKNSACTVQRKKESGSEDRKKKESEGVENPGVEEVEKGGMYRGTGVRGKHE